MSKSSATAAAALSYPRRHSSSSQPSSSSPHTNNNNSNDHYAIRPVTTRFPTTSSVWQDTNLPLACVLTPLAAPILDDDDGKKQSKPSYSSQRSLQGTSGASTFSSNSSHYRSSFKIMAKCLHCGAPHPVASIGLSHLRNYQQSSQHHHHHHQELLCFLCGKTSSTVWDDQYHARHVVEGWMLPLDQYREAYEKYPPLTVSTTTTSSSNSSSKYFYYHKHPPTPSQQHRPSQYHVCEYILPLLSLPSPQATTATAATEPWHTTQLPAMTCPPLWIIILDGTCPHRPYWQRVVQLLRRVLLSSSNDHDDNNNNDDDDDHHDEEEDYEEEHDNGRVRHAPPTVPPPPPCLHVAILSVQADHTCAMWDLSSPVPHVLQQPLWTQQQPQQQQRRRDSSNGGSGTTTTTTAAMATSLLQRLVPVDDFHIPHIATALRAMADIGPTLAASSAATMQKTQIPGERQAQYSLAETLAAILSWLEPCQLAGHVDVVDPLLLVPPPISSPGTTRTKSRTSMFADSPQTLSSSSSATTTSTPNPMYAGGKILCLLTAPPDEVADNDPVEPSMASQDRVVGRGGWGGSCSTTTPGQRFAISSGAIKSNTISQHAKAHHDNTNGITKEIDPEIAIDDTMDPSNVIAGNEDDDNMTLGALSRQYPFCQPNLVAMYSELGQQCAQAGLGIDILFLLEQSTEPELSSKSTTNHHHLGLPFLKVLSETSGAPGPLLFLWDSRDDNEEVDSRLEREVLARAPWGERVVLGAELRVRLTPGWSIDQQSGISPDGGGGSNPDSLDLNLASRYARAGLMGPASCAEPTESNNLWRMGSCDPYTSMAIDLLMTNPKQFSHWMIEGFGEVKVHPVIQTCFAYNAIRKDEEHNGQYVTERRLRIATRAMPLANSTETLFSSLDCDALAVVLFHKLALSSFQDGLTETLDIGQNWLKSVLLCAYRSAEAHEAKQGVDQDDDDDEDDVPTTTATSTKQMFLPNERLLDREGELSASDVLVAQGHDRLRHIPHILYSLLQCDAFRPSSATFRPTLDARCAVSAQLSSMTPSALVRSIKPRLDLWSSLEGQIIADQLDLQWKTIVSVVEEQESTQDNDFLLLLLDCSHKAAVYDTTCLTKEDHSAPGKPKVTESLQQLMKQAATKYRVAPSTEFELTQTAADLALQLRDILVEDAPLATGLTDYEEWKAEIAATVHEELSSDDI